MKEGRFIVYEGTNEIVAVVCSKQKSAQEKRESERENTRFTDLDSLMFWLIDICLAKQAHDDGKENFVSFAPPSN